jgi:hypothetical protein
MVAILPGSVGNSSLYVFYIQKKHNTPELLYLNTLLSNLVDQWKNGYLFAEDN